MEPNTSTQTCYREKKKHLTKILLKHNFCPLCFKLTGIYHLLISIIIHALIEYFDIILLEKVVMIFDC